MSVNAQNRNRTRVGGIFTVFYFMGKPLGYCQQVAHTSAQPVGPGAVAIQPMDEPYPVEVITPAAAGMGSFTLNLYELYESKVWERLGSEIQANQQDNGSNDNTSFNGGGILDGLNDIVDIFITVAAQDPSTMSVVKFVYPPVLPTTGGSAGTSRGSAYYEVFHNCVITDVRDGEQIAVETMEILKQIDIAYTYVTRGAKTPLAFLLRNQIGITTPPV